MLTEGPEARIIKPEGSGVYYSDQLTFEAQISDEEDGAEVVVGEQSDGVLGDVDTTPELDGSLLGHGYLTEGEHAIELSGEDTTGKTDRASVIIEVGPPNSAPLCDIIEPLTVPGPEGSAIQIVPCFRCRCVIGCTVAGSDKDGVLGESLRPVKERSTSLIRPICEPAQHHHDRC